MIKNAKKTDIEKQLIKFRNQFHNLLIKYPDVRIAGDQEGDVLAFVPSQEGPRTKVYLPRSGKQELIDKHAEEIAAEQSVYDEMAAFEERFVASMMR